MVLNFLKSREPGKIQRQCREGIGKATGDKHLQAGVRENPVLSQSRTSHPQ